MAAPDATGPIRPVLAITSGEPAGIGPDICLGLAHKAASNKIFPARVVVLGNRGLLRERARALGMPVQIVDSVDSVDSVDLVDFDPTRAAPAAGLEIVDLPLGVAVTAGRLDLRNSRYVLALLDRAIDGCVRGEFDAMVTAPLQKSVINDAGIPFIGHTEYLAERLAVPHVVMMLAGGGLRVALATTHLALKDVPRAITRDSLTATLRVLEHDLRVRFGLARPKIVVAGLNPHAGESGHMGREEIEVIEPVLRALRAEKFDLIGPTPADTLFHPAHLRGVDAVLAMFHDQGLPVLKFASFGQGVNITLGLPIVRTSVDHGTALAIAGRVDADGRPLADPSSLGSAIETAIQMCTTQRAPLRASQHGATPSV